MLFRSLDVLPYHTMGVVKYENLGMEYPLKGVKALTKEQAQKANHIVLAAIHEKREQLRAEGKL